MFNREECKEKKVWPQFRRQSIYLVKIRVREQSHQYRRSERYLAGNSRTDNHQDPGHHHCHHYQQFHDFLLPDYLATS